VATPDAVDAADRVRSTASSGYAVSVSDIWFTQVKFLA
jgi:hypothetical protein